ncbi:MAG: CPBP family intramembrane metalloprotease [candidate division KSB1 bacterium]|nr:CPBP family intramembrane metalloprotease [candidate division KSB1 bacterium]MDZ7347091.1 CPBP family intramembrane metalloprotease [candidate division KSB1 bacterium]
MDDLQKNGDLTPSDISRILAVTLLVFMVFFLVSGYLSNEAALIGGELLLIVPALYYAKKRGASVRSTFRLYSVRPKVLFAVLLVFLPLYVLTDELDRIIQMLAPMPEEWYESMMEMVTFTNWREAIGVLFGGAVVAAAAEEMLFRGLLQRSLERFRDPASAIVSASVLFALVHFNPWTSIQILLLGVALGYAAWKSGSVIPSMILHGLNNLLSMLFVNAPPEMLSGYEGEMHVRLPVLLAAAAAFYPAWRLFVQTCRESTPDREATD